MNSPAKSDGRSPSYCDIGLPFSLAGTVPGALAGDRDRYCAWRSWFVTTPVPVWVEDFSWVGERFRELAASGVKDLPAWLAAHPAEVRAMAAMVRVMDANQAAADILEAKSPTELIGDLTLGFEDDSYAHFLEELTLIARGERRFSVDILGHTFKGRRRLLRMQWTAGSGHEEDLSVVFLTGMDITDLVLTEANLRDALRAKDFFLKEIQHRVRNTLMLIESLLSMQARNSPDSAALLDAIARRVDTLAVVHDSLYYRRDPSVADLKDCVEGAARQAYHREGGSDKAEMELDSREIDLPINAATPVALIVGELTANAIRHGAQAGQRSKVRVSAGLLDGNRILITVSDRGAGLGNGGEAGLNRSQGLGLSLVEALAVQLKGSLTYERDRGLKVSLVFPLVFSGT